MSRLKSLPHQPLKEFSVRKEYKEGKSDLYSFFFFRYLKFTSSTVSLA